MPIAIAVLCLILLLSALAAGWVSRRKVAERPVKVMVFVGYFWLLTFLQLLLFALVYFVGQRFYPHWIS